MKKLMIIVTLLFSFMINKGLLESSLYGYRSDKNFDRYLQVYLHKLTIKEYIFENNKDYLIIDGKKKEVKFNDSKNTISTFNSIYISKKALNSLNLLKKADAKRIELILLAYKFGHKGEFQVFSWSLKSVYNLFNLLHLDKFKLRNYNLEHGFKLKGENLILNDYLYNLFECTGDNNFIYVDDMQYTIYFDRENSNMDALNSLYGLKWQLSYTIEDKIRIIGHYNKITKKFIIKHWYLDKPFGEIIQKNGEYLKTIKRSKFKRSDFTGKLKFNPKIYHSSKYFYKNNKIIKMSELKTDNLFDIYVKSLLSIFRVDKK